MHAFIFQDIPSGSESIFLVKMLNYKYNLCNLTQRKIKFFLLCTNFCHSYNKGHAITLACHIFKCKIINVTSSTQSLVVCWNPPVCHLSVCQFICLSVCPTFMFSAEILLEEISEVKKLPVT